MTSPQTLGLRVRSVRTAQAAAAILASASLLAAGLLGMRHEAEVTHATDVLTGQEVHAAVVVGHRDCDQVQLHPAAPASRRRSVLAGRRDPPAAHPERAAAGSAPRGAGHGRRARARPAAPAPSTALLHLAPKTSPPRA